VLWLSVVTAFVPSSSNFLGSTTTGLTTLVVPVASDISYYTLGGFTTGDSASDPFQQLNSRRDRRASSHSLVSETTASTISRTTLLMANTNNNNPWESTTRTYNASLPFNATLKLDLTLPNFLVNINNSQKSKTTEKQKKKGLLPKNDRVPKNNNNEAANIARSTTTTTNNNNNNEANNNRDVYGDPLLLTNTNPNQRPPIRPRPISPGPGLGPDRSRRRMANTSMDPTMNNNTTKAMSTSSTSIRVTKRPRPPPLLPTTQTQSSSSSSSSNRKVNVIWDDKNGKDTAGSSTSTDTSTRPRPSDPIKGQGGRGGEVTSSGNNSSASTSKSASKRTSSPWKLNISWKGEDITFAANRQKNSEQSDNDNPQTPTSQSTGNGNANAPIRNLQPFVPPRSTTTTKGSGSGNSQADDDDPKSTSTSLNRRRPPPPVQQQPSSQTTTTKKKGTTTPSTGTMDDLLARALAEKEKLLKGDGNTGTRDDGTSSNKEGPATTTNKEATLFGTKGATGSTSNKPFRLSFNNQGSSKEQAGGEQSTTNIRPVQSPLPAPMIKQQQPPPKKAVAIAKEAVPKQQQPPPPFQLFNNRASSAPPPPPNNTQTTNMETTTTPGGGGGGGVIRPLPKASPKRPPQQPTQPPAKKGGASSNVKMQPMPPPTASVIADGNEAAMKKSFSVPPTTGPTANNAGKGADDAADSKLQTTQNMGMGMERPPTKDAKASNNRPVVGEGEGGEAKALFQSTTSTSSMNQTQTPPQPPSAAAKEQEQDMANQNGSAVSPPPPKIMGGVRSDDKKEPRVIVSKPPAGGANNNPFQDIVTKNQTLPLPSSSPPSKQDSDNDNKANVKGTETKGEGTTAMSKEEETATKASLGGDSSSLTQQESSSSSSQSSLSSKSKSINSSSNSTVHDVVLGSVEEEPQQPSPPSPSIKEDDGVMTTANTNNKEEEVVSSPSSFSYVRGRPKVVGKKKKEDDPLTKILGVGASDNTQDNKDNPSKTKAARIVPLPGQPDNTNNNAKVLSPAVAPPTVSPPVGARDEANKKSSEIKGAPVLSSSRNNTNKKTNMDDLLARALKEKEKLATTGNKGGPAPSSKSKNDNDKVASSNRSSTILGAATTQTPSSKLPAPTTTTNNNKEEEKASNTNNNKPSSESGMFGGFAMPEIKMSLPDFFNNNKEPKKDEDDKKKVVSAVAPPPDAVAPPPLAARETTQKEEAVKGTTIWSSPLKMPQSQSSPNNTITNKKNTSVDVDVDVDVDDLLARALEEKEKLATSKGGPSSRAGPPKNKDSMAASNNRSSIIGATPATPPPSVKMPVPAPATTTKEEEIDNKKKKPKPSTGMFNLAMPEIKMSLPDFFNKDQKKAEDEDEKKKDSAAASTSILSSQGSKSKPLANKPSSRPSPTTTTAASDGPIMSGNNKLPPQNKPPYFAKEKEGDDAETTMTGSAKIRARNDSSKQPFLAREQEAATSSGSLRPSSSSKASEIDDLLARALAGREQLMKGKGAGASLSVGSSGKANTGSPSTNNGAKDNNPPIEEKQKRSGSGTSNSGPLFGMFNVALPEINIKNIGLPDIFGKKDQDKAKAAVPRRKDGDGRNGDPVRSAPKRRDPVDKGGRASSAFKNNVAPQQQARAPSRESMPMSMIDIRAREAAANEVKNKKEVDDAVREAMKMVDDAVKEESSTLPTDSTITKDQGADNSNSRSSSSTFARTNTMDSKVKKPPAVSISENQPSIKTTPPATAEEQTLSQKPRRNIEQAGVIETSILSSTTGTIMETKKKEGSIIATTAVQKGTVVTKSSVLETTSVNANVIAPPPLETKAPQAVPTAATTTTTGVPPMILPKQDLISLTTATTTTLTKKRQNIDGGAPALAIPRIKTVSVLVCPAQFCVPVDYDDLLENIEEYFSNNNNDDDDDDENQDFDFELGSLKVVSLPRTEWIKIAKSLPTMNYVKGSLKGRDALGWYYQAIEKAVAEIWSEQGDCGDDEGQQNNNSNRNHSICIIGHSIGGWVARGWLGGLGYTSTDVYRRALRDGRISSFITLGTPHMTPPNNSNNNAAVAMDQTRGLLAEVEASRYCSSDYLVNEADIAVTTVCSGSIESKLATTDTRKLLAASSYLSQAGWKDGMNIKGDGITPLSLGLMEEPANRIVVETNDNEASPIWHAHVLPTPWNVLDPIGPSYELPEDSLWYGSREILPTWAPYIE
jgi:hypothetical protein